MNAFFQTPEQSVALIAEGARTQVSPLKAVSTPPWFAGRPVTPAPDSKGGGGKGKGKMSYQQRMASWDWRHGDGKKSEPFFTREMLEKYREEDRGTFLRLRKKVEFQLIADDGQVVTNMEYEKALLLEQQTSEKTEDRTQAAHTGGAAASGFSFTSTQDSDDLTLGTPNSPRPGATPKRRPGPLGRSSIEALGYDPLKGIVSSKTKGNRYDPFGVGRGPLGGDWGRHLAAKDAEAERVRRDGWGAVGEEEEREEREGGEENGQGSGGAEASMEGK